jgi:hypothetical protein
VRVVCGSWAGLILKGDYTKLGGTNQAMLKLMREREEVAAGPPTHA